MSASATGQLDPALNRAISDAMVELNATFYQHDRTTATTYINDNIVNCVLENTADEDTLIAEGARGEVIDDRVAFQTDSQDELTAAVEHLTQRHVTASWARSQATHQTTRGNGRDGVRPGTRAHRRGGPASAERSSESGCPSSGLLARAAGTNNRKRPSGTSQSGTESCWSTAMVRTSASCMTSTSTLRAWAADRG